MEIANFAGWVAARLLPQSRLVDAASGVVLSGLRERLSAAAAAFLSRGLPAGGRVVVASRQDPETALAILGAMHAGLVPVPVDASEHAAIEGLLDRTEALALWSGRAEHVSLAGSRVFLQGHPDPVPGHAMAAVERQGADLAALMPTSGTTGSPRLVMVTHANLIANTSAIIQSQGLGPADVAMLILPLSYCFGASVLFSHLAVGGSVVLDRRFMFPDKVLQAMADQACSTFAGVPSVYNILLRRSSLGKTPLPALRRLLQAGGRLAPEHVDEVCQRLPHAEFHVMYGQTEATSRIASLAPEHAASQRGSVGRALSNLRLRIVDEQRRPLPPMQVGAIEASGPSICPGYWDDAPASAQRFPDDWLRTGDRGWMDDQGYLWIDGRNGDFLKIRGRRVSYAEIEGAAQAVPGVHEAAVLSSRDPEAGEVPIVCVVPATADDVDGLAERVRQALPVAWTCSRVVVLPSFPLNASGKLDRNALRSRVDTE